MTNNPLVSIGMPVKNGEKTIIRALESVINQTYKNYEIIIADNKSSDNTKNVVQHYIKNHKNIRLLSHISEISASENFYFTLKEANGKYFAWLSDDDYWDQDFMKDGIRRLTEGFDFFCPNWASGNLDLGQIRSHDKNILHFLMTKDEPRKKTLNYINLHFRSQKTCVVYSIFKTDFLINVFLMQSIEDDGALGALIANKGNGYISDRAYFFKETTFFEPMALPLLNYRKNGSALNLMRYFKYLLISFLQDRFDEKNFYVSKEKSLKNHLRLFPELRPQLEKIFKNYRFRSHKENYLILKKSNLT
jgi:glycosyltransferase involved in cell wall biosynthesis